MKTIIFCTLALTFLASFKIPKKYDSYIKQHLHKAKMLQSSTGVPVSITFAQAIYESQCGSSNIAQKAKNHFGIRCGDHWTGQRYHSSSGCWRKYDSVGESFLDHACYLNDAYPYAAGKPWTHWVKYCTGYGAPGYWGKIKKIIITYKLYELDK